MDNHQFNNTDLPTAQSTPSKEETTLEENVSSSAPEIPKEEHHHSGHHHHSSHHHRHHHHGHHSRHRHRSRSKKKKFKLNSKFTLLLSAILLVFLITFIVVDEIRGSRPAGGDPTTGGDTTSQTLTVELINKEGILVKDAVSKYLAMELFSPENELKKLYSFSNNGGRLDVQVPVGLKLSVKKGNAIAYKIELADNDTFVNAEVSYVEASSGTYEFEHLYANTTYYYRVTAYTNKGFDTVTGHFETADTPRILTIDGIRNVRDIGNWKTDSGKRIKQGLLIRGTELDGAEYPSYCLTNKGTMDLLEVFGIKTDMDLRSQGRLEISYTKDALGALVEHKYYNMVMYDDIFTEQGKEKVKAVFSDLANPENYPIYLHCTYGEDRTGTVCYLLEALLGVSNIDCLREYGLSNRTFEEILKVQEGLKSYPGNTLKERTEAYLLSCEITAEQIESIRNIFLSE